MRGQSQDPHLSDDLCTEIGPAFAALAQPSSSLPLPQAHGCCNFLCNCRDALSTVLPVTSLGDGFITSRSPEGQADHQRVRNGPGAHN